MPRPIRILELRSVRGTGGGPEKTILLGAARSDPARFAVTVCYIRDARDEVFSIDQRADGLPIDYVEIRERSSTDWRVWPELKQLVREKKIDIAHAHDYKTDLLVWLLGRGRHAIPLTTAHGWTGNSSREALYYRADKWLLARYPRVIAVSEEIRRAIVQAGAAPERVTTILNGIDHRAFRRDRDPAKKAAARAALGVHAGEIVIGAVGRLERQKRFDVLLEAFARLAPSRPQLRLLIAGEGSLRGELTAQIDRLGLATGRDNDSARCRLLGQWNDIAQFHHAIDLLVQSSEYEGTPNVVLEAMAFETPVVATDVGGTAELVHHETHGLIVPPGDIDALAAAITQALDDPTAAATRATAARIRVEGDLSFDRRMQRVEAIYDELIAQAGR
jgi:glycosyltransferase involved in cell wall biosynthesis